MSAATRAITVNFTAPADTGDTFQGVYLYVNMPAQTGVRGDLNTATPLDGTGSLGGVATPLVYGPFPWTDFPGSATIMIPEPVTHPMQCSVTVVSYSGAVIQPVASGVTVAFTIPVYITDSRGAAYTRNPLAAAVVSNTQSLSTGRSYTSLVVSQSAPADPTFQGVVYVIVDAAGNIFLESPPQTGATATLTFPTPGAVGTYTVYATGWDGANANPIVAGVTPSFTVTLGTTAGTIAPSQIPMAGPLYVDISGKLNQQLSADFLVAGGVLTQNAVNFAKAYNFGSEFTVSGGAFVVNAIAVNKLLAGTALFAGTATFANASNPFAVQIGAAGVTLADNYAAPTCTVTVTATGATVAKGSISVQVAAGGVTITSGAQTGTFTATGITFASGAYQVTLGASSILISNGTAYVQVSAAGVAINQAILSLNLNGTTTTISNVFDTNASAYVGLKVLDNSTNYYSIVLANGFSIFDPSGNAIVSLIKNGLGDYGSLQLVAPGSSRKIYIDPQGQAIKIGGVFPTQVLTVQQAGPGTPAFGTLANAQAWCANLLAALQTHGLVT